MFAHTECKKYSNHTSGNYSLVLSSKLSELADVAFLSIHTYISIAIGMQVIFIDFVKHVELEVLDGFPRLGVVTNEHNNWVASHAFRSLTVMTHALRYVSKL